MNVCSCCFVLVMVLTLGRAQPSLVSFSLSLTPPELLTLTFDSSLRASSCDVSKLTLQNSSTLTIGGSYSPQDSTICSFVGGLTVTLNTVLSSDDWAAIQANIYLATTVESTYISMQAGFLTEDSNIPISSSAALQVTPHLFSDNINPPTVVEALLDLDAGIMMLHLYEGSFYLASAPIGFIDSTGNGGEVTLNEFSTPNNAEFFFELPSFLVYSFKVAFPPFLLSLPPSLFQDSSGTPSPTQTELPVTVVPDTTPPNIESFTFDLNVGQLDMTFDEPININSINMTHGIYLTDSFQGSNGSIHVSVIELTSENLNTQLSLIVSNSTLNFVKFHTSICTNSANCLLGVTTSSITDTSNNTIPPSFSNIAAERFIADTTRPKLISYTINLDSSSIAFTFNEPIEPMSFDPYGITLDIDTNNLITSGEFEEPIQYPSVCLGGGSSVVGTPEENTVIQIQLESSLLVDLKFLVTLGPITCIIEDITVYDTNNNMVMPILSNTSFPPAHIILDQTPPELLEFIASPPEAAQLKFVFSESVDVSSWNISALILTLLTTEGSYDYTFSEGFVEEDGSNNIVTFTIGNSHLIFSSLIEHYQDAYVSGSLAVTTRSSLVDDLFGNPLLPVTQPLLYNATITGISPELLTVDFDLNTGMLNMVFSDVVVVGFSSGRVRFQDDSIFPTHTFTLLGNGSYSSTGEVGTSISLSLTTEDLNGLKLNPFLATSTANTFVELAENFAYGLGSIPLVEQNATQVTMFIPDTLEPVVISFDLDLDSNILSIEFNEPVPVYTFDESRILLLSSSTPDSETSRVSLTDTYTLATGNATSLRALISAQDAIDIKRQPLCYSVDNCFVVFDEYLVSDVSGNTFLASVMAEQVSSVSPDVTPPQLVSFPVFDLDSEIFTLIFSEPVNGSSTEYTVVEFHNAPLNANTSVTLTEGITSPDHIQIDFHMSRDDLNQLKYHLDLCINRDDCWIRLPSFFITDIGRNPFIHSYYQSDVAASFHQPVVFIPDRTHPELEIVCMDLNQGTLTLSFSEVIVEATFTPSDITLLESPSSSISLPVSSDSVYYLSSSGAQIVIELTLNDLNWLKAQQLFTDPYISLVTNLIDVSENQFQNISTDSGFQVSEVIPDTTQPQLVSFDTFNVENNSFTISFNEPVNASSFDVTQVRLLNQPSDSATLYTLTGAALSIDETLLSLTVTLTNSDRVEIKLLTSLATVHSNTYMTMNANAIKDTSGNANAIIPNTHAIQLSTGGYIPDISPASLVKFGMDLDASSLVLMFDDVIDSSSIDATSLTIQNSVSNPTSSLTLSASSISMNENNHHIITILLSQDDLLKLKLDLGLATSTDDTYISIESSFANDVEGRPVNAISQASALSLTSSFFIPDTTSPYLLLFTLDMNTGILQLIFSEPILPSSVDPSQLTLHGQRSEHGTSRTLGSTTPIITGTSASLNVELQLLQSDLNYIKDAQDLAIDTGTTYTSFTRDLVKDVSGNSITAIPVNDSIRAAMFTIDTTPPELIGFVADLTPVAKIYLTFSETVHLNGLIQTTISMSDAPIDPMIIVLLTESDVSDQTNFDQVEISLSPPIITRLLVDTIASSVETLYLSITQGVVEDTNGNPIVPVDAYQVKELYKSCFSDTYNNATLGECFDCPVECAGSCTGPDTVVGDGGCDSCAALLLDQDGNQLRCFDPTSPTCPLGYFSTSLSSLTTTLPPTITESTLLCQPCDSLCSSCDGPTTSDCETCKFAFFTNTSTALVACVQSCDPTNAADCVTCHEQCCGCTGPTFRDCVTCEEDSIISEQGELICIPTCTGNTYLTQENGEYICLQCNSQCIGCTGGSNTECNKCLNVNLTANGLSMCLESCPTGYYTNAVDNVCLPCHDYCVDCIGPSNKNCTECVDDEEDGQCVPSCPFGQEYDTAEEACTLTREVYYLTIATSCLGGIIILLIVLLIVVCFCYHLKKKRDKKGVFFVSATFDINGQELHPLKNQ